MKLINIICLITSIALIVLFIFTLNYSLLIISILVDIVSLLITINNKLELMFAHQKLNHKFNICYHQEIRDKLDVINYHNATEKNLETFKDSKKTT